jgi:two-component system response regulator CpxR
MVASGDVTMSPTTILLAEDDLDIRDILQELLEENGYDVIPARTGKQALDFLSMDPRSPPHIVILDLMMPIVTGWQVLEVLQRDPAYAKVSVVVVTAASQDRPTGVAAFIRKPFRIEALLETVQRLESGNPA